MMTEAATTKIAETFKRARQRGVPLIGVRTPDQFATAAQLASQAGSVPVLTWDINRGLVPQTSAATAWVNALTKAAPPQLPQPGQPPPPPPFTLARTVDPAVMLTLLASGKPGDKPAEAKPLPENGLVLMYNAHRFIDHPAVLQGIQNLRDLFKDNGRTLVMLGPDMRLPVELTNDVLVFTEKLPGEEVIREIVTTQYENAGLSAPDKVTLDKATDASLGLSAFAAEQINALCLNPKGMDVDMLWDRKRGVVEQTPGLKVWRGNESYADLGGANGIKEFVKALFDNSGEAPRVVMFLDEIEKAIAGNRGDLNGIAQDQVSQILTFSQDRDAVGLLLVGGPGTGKSMFAKATGNLGGVPTIQFDLGAMMGSLVGQSQAMIRHALDVVDAVGQGRVLMLATCNSLDVLPPELRRRFKFGLWYFDLPDAATRAAIWTTYVKQFKITKDQLAERPNDENWTGAEIRACCEIAYRTKFTLAKASRFVTPVYRAQPDIIDTLRAQATGKFIDAGTGENYKPPVATVDPVALGASIPSKRSIKLQES